MPRSPRLLLVILVASAVLCAQQPAQPAPAQQTTGQQQPAASGSQQIPVQDLTPPSDYQLEVAAAEAKKKADEEAAALAAKNPNQPTGATTVPNPPRQKDGAYIFRAQVEEVMLYATVVDPRNRLVTTLDRDNFTVYEDNVPQKITSFHRQDIPVSLGLIIDNSGTMRLKRPAVNQAALNLVRASNPQDEVFVENFTNSDDIYLDQAFTADINLLKEALEKIDSRGSTALYDAVIAGADYLGKGGKHDKKILLVITDGEDNASVKTLEEAVNFVQKENGPTVYTIGILDSKEKRAAKRARRALERLSLETGGIAFFPSSLNEVDAISREIARDIRSQYAIGYKPSRPQSEGGFRTVRVEATEGKSKLQVRTKSGYYAGQRPQTSQPTSGK
jgi:Ca-activated chloride channel homolog